MSPYRPQYANDECGRGTRGAWGAGTPPTVYRVSNLHDSGAGSLRAALEASGPRVVVFETSGAIIARSDYTISQPYCTVAGQTAPSPGITLQGDPSGGSSSGGLSITGHDVVVQHLRVRPGDCPPVLAPTAAHDGMAIFYEGASNVVIDHCSVSWVGGKTLQAFGIAQDAGVSFWRCIGAEALYYSANTDYNQIAPGNPSSLGMLLAQNYNNKPATMAVVGCLLAHCSDRNPEIQGPVRALLVNNLVYDWGRDQTNYQWATFVCAYDGALGPMAVDIIGNHYIGGNPALGTPPPFTPLYAFGTWGLNPGSQVHLSDNVYDGAEPANVNGLDPRVGSPCSGLSYPNTGPGAHVLDFVTAQAGARPTDRDDVDRRIVEQVRTKTGTVIQSQSAVGGWPALAVNVRALSLPNVADEAAFKAVLEQYAVALEEGTAPPVEPPTGELDEGKQEEGENKPPPVG